MGLLALSATGQTALIVAGASIAAALVTAGAATYGARAKIREVQLSYSQKLHESYLGTARQYTNSVYIPLTVALSNLSDAFVSFRDGLDSKTRNADEEAERRFRAACSEFLDEIDAFTRRGSDAFLTTALEEVLLSFTVFLRKSLVSNEARTGVVIGEASVEVSPRFGELISMSSYVLGSLSLLLPLKGLGTGLGLALRPGADKKLLEAPIRSKLFEERVVDDLRLLRILIKEVTLGAQGGPSL